jgi:predicted TIM-barrel fold metal-dependent hydrolase
MQRYRLFTTFIPFGLCLFLWGADARSEALYFIDAHSQVDHNIELDEVLKRMRAAGIKKTILAARGRRQSRDIAALAQAHPELIIAAVRTKSWHYKSNSRKYYKKLASQLASGRFNAMAEVLLYHAQKGDRAGEVEIYPDDQRVEAALAGARKSGWPFVLHIEFASLGSSQKRKYFRKLDQLLNKYPDYPFVLIHMGQLQAPEVKKLILKHRNLYFFTSHSNPVAVNRSNQPWVNMFKEGKLTPGWQSLVISYPKRFIFALDNVWPEHWRNGYNEQVLLWRQAIKKLPPEVAHALAHGNAESLWKLKHN